MQKIYIARPGAQKEGPYTLEQINRDLAAKKINDTDFWAWHEGLPTWQPLYSLSGVTPMAGSTIVHEANPRTLTPKAATEPGARQVKPESNNSKSHSVPVLEGHAELKARGPSSTAPAVEVNTESRAKAAPAVLKNPQPVAAKIAPESVAAVKPESISPTFETATRPVAEPEPMPPEVEVRTEPQSRKAEAMTAPVSITHSGKPEALAAPAAKSGPATPEVEPEPKATEVFAAPSMSSGKPFTALEQIFVFTTGEGRAAFKSEITAGMLSEAAGQKLETIRSTVPVDVIGSADARVLEAIRAGSLPGSAWRALLKIKPAVARQAQDGLYHLCVRTFPVESKELVAMFLLYNKQKL